MLGFTPVLYNGDRFSPFAKAEHNIDLLCGSFCLRWDFVNKDKHPITSSVGCSFASSGTLSVVPKSDCLPESDCRPRERAQQPVER